jgi:hypothetical protein
MPAAAQPSESDPTSHNIRDLVGPAGLSARVRLEEAVGPELALRLVSALTGPHGRGSELTL